VGRETRNEIEERKLGESRDPSRSEEIK